MICSSEKRFFMRGLTLLMKTLLTSPCVNEWAADQRQAIICSLNMKYIAIFRKLFYKDNSVPKNVKTPVLMLLTENHKS